MAIRQAIVALTISIDADLTRITLDRVTGITGAITVLAFYEAFMPVLQVLTLAIDAVAGRLVGNPGIAVTVSRRRRLADDRRARASTLNTCVSFRARIPV